MTTTHQTQLTLFTLGDLNDQEPRLLDALFQSPRGRELTVAFWPHPGPDRGYSPDAERELLNAMTSYGLDRFPSWGLIRPDGIRVGTAAINTPETLEVWINKNLDQDRNERASNKGTITS